MSYTITLHTKIILQCLCHGVGGADAVNGCAYYAAGIACTLSSRVQTSHCDVAESFGITRDAYRG